MKYLPSINWMKTYRRSDLRGDLVAGITVAVLLIPQGMAYSMLAGLPPVYGLYAVTIPLLLYGLLGTSRQLAVGPVAMVALLIASGLEGLADPGSTDYIQLAILLALLVGIIQLVMGLTGMGYLVNFLAHPVVAGFTSAVAIIIAVSQMRLLLGLDIGRGGVVETLIAIAKDIALTHRPTALLGFSAIALLLLGRRYSSVIPTPLVLVVLSVIAIRLLDLDTAGVKIVRDVPSGLPSFTLPHWDRGSVMTLLPMAFTIALVGFMESIAVAQKLQRRYKDYTIDSSQELRALGMANLVGSFFQSFPVTGGFSRSAVNDEAGARTGLASIISSVLIMLSLLFFTQLFYYIPIVVLAAIIIVAVSRLIDFSELRMLWRTDRQDALLFAVTFLVTLLVSVETGIIVGVALSILMLALFSSRPHVAILGEIKGTGVYRNVDRFPDARTVVDTIIIRPDAPLYFANVHSIKSVVRNAIVDHRYIILHCGSMTRLDSSGAEALKELSQEAAEQSCVLIMSDMIGPVRDTMRRHGLFADLGNSRFYATVEDAVDSIESSADDRLSGIQLQSEL